MTYQKLWDTAKAVLRGKFIALNMYIGKGKVSNNLSPTLRTQEKRAIKPKTKQNFRVSKGKYYNKRAEINVIEKNREKSNKQASS